MSVFSAPLVITSNTAPSGLFSHFIKHGTAKHSPELEKWLQSGSSASLLHGPTWQPGRTHNELAVKIRRSKSWAANSIPIGQEEVIIAGYWSLRFHNALWSVIAGIMAHNLKPQTGSSTHQRGDLLFDVSGSAYVQDVTDFNRANLVSAIAPIKHLVTDVVVHNDVYRKIKARNLIDCRVFTQEHYLDGIRITVDDSVPCSPSTGVYSSYFFGPGFIEFAEYKDPVRGRQRVTDLSGRVDVWDLVEWCAHPMGYRFLGTAPPTNLELATPTNWARSATARDHIPMVCLQTREY